MAELQKEDLFDLASLSDNRQSGISDPFFEEESDGDLDGRKYVVFEVNDQNYAIPSEQVHEVIRMLPVTVIPNIPEWFLGIANLRGTIVSVIDMSALLNKELGKDFPKSKLIVLNSEDSDSHLALRVDRLREIVVLSDDQIKTSSGKDKNLLAGVATFKSSELNVLDVSKIVASLALL